MMRPGCVTGGVRLPGVLGTAGGLTVGVAAGLWAGTAGGGVGTWLWASAVGARSSMRAAKGTPSGSLCAKSAVLAQVGGMSSLIFDESAARRGVTKLATVPRHTTSSNQLQAQSAMIME